MWETYRRSDSTNCGVGAGSLRVPVVEKIDLSQRLVTLQNGVPEFASSHDEMKLPIVKIFTRQARQSETVTAQM